MPPRPSRYGRIGLHTWWVQVVLSLLLASLVVTQVLPRVRASWKTHTHERPMPFTDRPHGLLSLDETLYLLRPAELGLTAWRPGQFATYEQVSLEEGPTHGGIERKRDVRVEVLRPMHPEDRVASVFEEPDEDLHWVRIDGMRWFRQSALEIYRLVCPHDLRITDAQRCYVHQENYIPLRNVSILGPGVSLGLRPLGQELVGIDTGALLCERLELRLVSSDPEVEDESVGELWFNRTVAPFGVVQLKVSTGVLRLRDFGEGPASQCAEPMVHLVEGRTTFEQFCHSCHGETCHDRIYPPQ